MSIIELRTLTKIFSGTETPDAAFTSSNNLMASSAEDFGQLNTTDASNDTVTGLIWGGAGDPAATVRWVCEVLLTMPISMLGLIGNALVIVVFSRQRQKLSTTTLLQVLSVADSCFLVCALLLYPINYLGISSRARVYLEYWLRPCTYWLRMVNTWLTVILTSDRYVAVCRPLHAQSLSSTKKTALQIIVVIIAAPLFSLPRFFEYTIQDTNERLGTVKTLLLSSRTYTYIYRLALFSILQYVAPITILVVLNGCMLVNLHRSSSYRDLTCRTYATVETVAAVTTSPNIVGGGEGRGGGRGWLSKPGDVVQLCVEAGGRDSRALLTLKEPRGGGTKGCRGGGERSGGEGAGGGNENGKSGGGGEGGARGKGTGKEGRRADGGVRGRCGYGRGRKGSDNDGKDERTEDVHEARRDRRHREITGRPVDGGRTDGVLRRRRRTSSIQPVSHHRSVTVIVITVVIVCVTCNVGAMLSQVLWTVELSSDDSWKLRTRTHRALLSNISNVCIVVNSSVNFVIYLLCSRNFRAGFLRLFVLFSSCPSCRCDKVDRCDHHRGLSRNGRGVVHWLPPHEGEGHVVVETGVGGAGRREMGEVFYGVADAEGDAYDLRRDCGVSNVCRPAAGKIIVSAHSQDSASRKY